MQPSDDSAIDVRLRRYYDGIPIPSRSLHAIHRTNGHARGRLASAAAIAVIVLGGVAVAARDDLQATAMRSVESMLSARFRYPVGEQKQVIVATDTAQRRLAELGMELPRGLPDDMQLASLHTVQGNGGWFIATYRVPRRSGEAVFSIVSTRVTPRSEGGNVALDDVAAPGHRRTAFWRTPAEEVWLISRGDALSKAEIRIIKEASTRRH